jgi:hypothetical protein
VPGMPGRPMGAPPPGFARGFPPQPQPPQ